MRARSIHIVAASLLLACGGEMPVPGDDAGRSDSGAASRDAGTDAGGDADGDGDGVPARVDCDDADPAVGASAERACSTECGGGMERCTDGVWTACDAPTDCACSTPGMMRLVGCERCGMQSQRCSDSMVWEAVSECLGQGECEVAAVETRMTPRCGTEQRLCGSTCAWGAWSSVVADGECEPGTSDFCSPDDLNRRRCDESCRWNDDECI